ncbi:hypothetical protein D3C73_1567940 [compost metagenome]
MHKGQTVPFNLLHDEAFTAEEARAELPLEIDAHRHAFGRTEEGILLAYNLAAQLA